jgi:uncharacterized protein (PEP-CTERM system associated)
MGGAWRQRTNLLLILGAILPSMPCQADDWVIKPSVSLYESYTSNAGLEPIGQGNSDFFTTLVPSINVRGDTARLKLNLNYSLDAIAYIENPDLDQIRNNLNFVSTLTLVPELLFLDGTASVQQVPGNGQLSISGSPLAAATNQDTVAVYNVSPYMKNHFGTFADSEFRYTFNQIYSDDPSQLPNATSNRLTETLVSGSQFTRLLWTALAEGANTFFAGSTPDTSSLLAEASAEYRLDRQIGLLGSVGFEQISDPTFFPEPEPNGPIGSIGVKFTPGPRTSIILNLNHRYNSTFLTGSGSYFIGAQTRIRADYTDQVYTSSQSLFANNLSFLTTDEFGNFIDSRTEQQFSLASTNFGFQTDAFRQRNLDLNFHAVRGRNAFDAIAYWQDRNVFLTGENDRAIGGAVNWGRALTPAADLNLTVRYVDEQFATGFSNDHQQLVGIGGSLAYQLNDALEGILALNFTRKFADVPSNEFVETVVSVGLQKRF